MIRIHFAVGSTAMAKVVDITDRVTLAQFAERLCRTREEDSTITFSNPGGEGFVLAARSIVLVEEVSS
jgi:hypothetical protein